MVEDDLNAVEGVPFVVMLDDEEQQRRRDETVSHREVYNKWEKIAKVCVCFSAVVYLVSLAFVVHYKEPKFEVATLHETYSSSIAMHPVDREELSSFDDDTTVWEDPSVPQKRLANWDDIPLSAHIVKSKDDFYQQLSSPDSIVAFQTDWCVWSQRLRPIWQAFAREYSGRGVNIVEVDCAKLEDVCRKEKILAFPTMRWYRDGESFDEYRRDRTVTALGEYLESQMKGREHTSDGIRKTEQQEPVLPPTEEEKEEELPRAAVELTEGQDLSAEQVLHSSMSVEMNILNFHKIVVSELATFVTFYGHGSPYSRPKPNEWDHLAANLQDVNIIVGHVDCGKERLLCDIEDITSSPEFRWYRRGRPQVGHIPKEEQHNGGYLAEIVAMQSREHDMAMKGVMELLDDGIIEDGPPLRQRGNDLILYVVDPDDDKSRTALKNWEEVRNMYAATDLGVRFETVHCGTHARLCVENHVYSTGVRLYHNGQYILSYSGPHDTLALPYFLNTLITKYPFPEERANFVLEEAPKMRVHESLDSEDEEYEVVRSDEEESFPSDDDTLEALEAEESRESPDDEDVPRFSIVTNVTMSNFNQVVEKANYAFVDFETSWCVWCQRLAPTWDSLADRVASYGLDVVIGRVDCVAEAELCRSQAIMAFPTLRLFRRGKGAVPDYKMERTVDALLQHVRGIIDEPAIVGHEKQLEMDERVFYGEEGAVDAEGVAEEHVVDGPASSFTSFSRDDDYDERSSDEEYEGDISIEEESFPSDDDATRVAIEAEEPREYPDDEDAPRHNVATKITLSNFYEIVGKANLAFVDFDSSRCTLCERRQRVLTMWDALADRISATGLDVVVGQVDCAEEEELCLSQSLMDYPTLRLFRNGKKAVQDYKMEPSVDALFQHVLGFTSINESSQVAEA